jgi:hypothetical protein
LISSERASTLRAAANNFRIESASCAACSNESPHEAAASATAESPGPAIHIARNPSRRGSAFFNAGATARRENDRWRTSSVIDGERKEKFALNRDLLFDEHSLNGKLSNFHFQHPRRMTTGDVWLFRKATPPMPARRWSKPES